MGIKLCKEIFCCVKRIEPNNNNSINDIDHFSYCHQVNIDALKIAVDNLTKELEFQKKINKDLESKYTDISFLYEDIKESLNNKLESIGEQKLDEEYVSIFNRNFLNENKNEDNDEIDTPRSI